MKTYNWEGVNPDGYFLDKLEPIPSALPSFQKLFQVSDRKSGSAGMPRPISYAVFCLKKKNGNLVELNIKTINRLMRSTSPFCSAYVLVEVCPTTLNLASG